MGRVAFSSPVSADDAIGFIQDVFGGETLSSADFEILLGMVVSQAGESILQAYGLILDVRGPMCCWLQCRDSGVGVSLVLRNTEDGVRIFQMKDLGGGRRCGWWGAAAA